MRFDEEPDAPIHGECAAEIHRLAQQRDELVDICKALIEFIDAIPKELQLPAMPGIDRDYVSDVIAKIEESK